MPVIGITGGIASGKSVCTRLLASRITAKVFDADAVARELVENDAGIKQAIVDRFGPRILDAGGGVDRGRLREMVFGDPQRRKGLEEILHPVIRARWIAQAQTALEKGEWLLVEIPLLYETGAETECDGVVVVACPPATQRLRIMLQRGLPEEMAEQIIASQASLASKVTRADFVIWNDAPLARLEEQVELFAGYLGIRYGRTTCLT